MRLSANRLPSAILAGLLAWTALTGMPSHADTLGDPESSPKTVLNQQTYLWLLPRFWMAGDKSYAVFHVENKLDHGISFYIDCRTSDGIISEISGRHSLAPGAVKIVDSRRHRSRSTARNAMLVNCFIKSHSLATVSYLIQDGRIKNFGDRMRVLQPEVG